MVNVTIRLLIFSFPREQKLGPNIEHVLRVVR